MKPAAVVVVLQILLVCGVPRPNSHRLVKRAANLNPGFNIEAFRKDQLDLHNHYRALHGLGPMTRDTILTNEAQAYAEYLAANNLFQHCRNSNCNPQNSGENLAYARGSTSVETNATLRWYKEVYYYNYCSWPNGRATTRPGYSGKQVGHFTQIVWKDSTKLGIGYARSSDRREVYVVGRYSPAGNFIGQYDEKVPKANYLLDKYQDNCNGNNGAFTDWSQPGACSKTCGRGVRFETRSCTNPKPSYNGQDCLGNTKRVNQFWCNTQACTVNVDDRAEQCKKRGYEENAYEFGNARCNLYCFITSDDTYFQRGLVDDGTHCHDNNNNLAGACVNGQCITTLQDPPPSSSITTTTTNTKPPSTTTTTTATPSTSTTTAEPPSTTTTTTANPSSSTPTTIPAPPSSSTTTSTTQSPSTTTTTTLAPSTTGSCTKICGGGVSLGANQQLVNNIWCNPQPCNPSINERDEQCKEKGYLADAYNFGGSDECILYCRYSNGYYYNRGSVDTGTHCSTASGALGACVNNVCETMQYAEGTVIEGEYKATVSNSFSNNIVVTIPKGATAVQITDKSNLAVRPVAGYRSNSGFSGYNYRTNGDVNIKGVTVTYNSGDITINGPVIPTEGNQIVVFALPNGGNQADITYKYTP